MTRRPRGHWRIAALLGFLALVILAVPPPSTGRPPSTSEPIITWTAIPSFLSVAPTSKSATAYEPSPTASANATHRPTVAPVALTQRPSASVSGHSIAGVASWYRYVPGGAAAGPALRRALGPGWRGTVVTVCASRCIRVTLSDWCGCTTANEKLIDLDRSSFAQLADPSRGVVKVTVRWRTSP